MHKQFKVPVKLLLIATIAVLSLLMVSGLALADLTTDPGGADRFEIIEFTNSTAYFSIGETSGDGDCDDTNEHCTVKVTKPTDVAIFTTDDAWHDEFNKRCNATVMENSSEGTQNKAFEACWSDDTEGAYRVEWPIIRPDRRAKFDITPHCDDNDDECAVELQICYNPDDCNPSDVDARDRDTYKTTRVGRFWEDANDDGDEEFCLYDDDDDKVWDCINEEFQDWLDKLRSSDDYNDFIDELEDDEDRLGIATDDDGDYDDDLNDVGTESDSRDDDDEEQTSAETYQRRWRTARVTPIFEDEDEVDAAGYSFRPSRDDYLTVDFTSYLDLSGSAQVCNTNIGCFNLVGNSSFFRQYLTSFYVQITGRTVVNCMDRRGYDVDDDHAINLNNQDLIFCDERVAEAVNLCPRENIGADFILYELYSSGLLTGILSDSAANSMRTSLEAARVVTPQCLCAAGFNESQMIISERESPDPWFSTTARRPEDVCN